MSGTRIFIFTEHRLLNTGYENIPSNRLGATEAQIHPSIRTYVHTNIHTSVRIDTQTERRHFKNHIPFLHRKF
jgi:hypothetical protein